MRLIGRVGNILYHHLDGANIHIESKLDTCSLSDVKDYAYDVLEFSHKHFINLATYGESNCIEVEAITKADKDILKLLEANSWDGDESDRFLQ